MSTTFTSIFGSTVTAETRADLLKHHPAFVGLNADSDGNPCVWMNNYCCQACTSEQINWQSAWSCQCDDDCPNCGQIHAPQSSDWIADCGSWGEEGTPIKDAYRLWQSLPESAAAYPPPILPEAMVQVDETPSARGARIMMMLQDEYGGDHTTLIRDALTDLRHACDNYGISYADEDDAAMSHYQAEIADGNLRDYRSALIDRLMEQPWGPPIAMPPDQRKAALRTIANLFMALRPDLQPHAHVGDWLTVHDKELCPNERGVGWSLLSLMTQP